GVGGATGLKRFGALLIDFGAYWHPPAGLPGAIILARTRNASRIKFLFAGLPRAPERLRGLAFGEHTRPVFGLNFFWFRPVGQGLNIHCFLISLVAVCATIIISQDIQAVKVKPVPIVRENRIGRRIFWVLVVAAEELCQRQPSL